MISDPSVLNVNVFWFLDSELNVSLGCGDRFLRFRDNTDQEDD